MEVLASDILVNFPSLDCKYQLKVNSFAFGVQTPLLHSRVEFSVAEPDIAGRVVLYGAAKLFEIAREVV